MTTGNDQPSQVGDLGEFLDSLELGDTEGFLSEGFDVKNHANTILQSGISISSQLAKISEGILLLNKELHSQVVAHHDNLLSQASGAEKLEGVLQVMQNRIQSLLSTTDRIRVKVTEPYNRIMVRMQQLIRLQETCDMLRRIIRISYLTKRLRVQLQGGVREITKTAQSLSELRTLSEGADLNGIELLESDRRIIAQARTEVESQANKMLNSGVSNLNQNQVGTALQVFYNLNLLVDTVNGVISSSRSKLEQTMDQSLDVKALSDSVKARRDITDNAPGRVNAPVNSAAFRANLWTSMEKLVEQVYTSCSQVNHLHKVLSKKRDPVTQVCFLNEYAKHHDCNILATFWTDVTAMLHKKLAAAVNRSNLVKQAFEGEFPKLLRLLCELWVRLNQFFTEASHVDASSEFLEGSGNEERMESFDAEKMLREAVNNFNTAYLSRSLSRLFDPINLIFQQGSLTVPSNEEVNGLVKTIESELNVAVFDTHLAASVAKNIAKTIKMFSVKSEQLLSTDGEASQVIDVATAGQRRNAAAVNSLHHLQVQMTRLLDGSVQGYNKESMQLMANAVQDITNLMKNAVQPLLGSVNDSMEAIILTMHQEDFSSELPSQNESQCSLYMKELKEFLARVNSEYLSLFECTDFILECIQPYVCNGIELFVRHSSLLRPIGDGGKMRLAADFAQMELAVHPLCKRVGDLGRSYKLLRAFRPLLFQSNEHILNSQTVGDVIPYSVALHFLFARAPDQLRSPHQVANWSLSRYTNWLENHPSEQDRLTLIKGALESYVKSVSTSGGTSYAPVYPIMLELLQRGLKEGAK